MSRLRFSGHDSFHCRYLWLKKGYDFINKETQQEFSNDRAVVSLGVGKNMVTAIQYWLDSFGIRDNENKSKTTLLADKILRDNGWDPYLEDIGSLWLLHYQLVSYSHASIYDIIFNHFRKQRIEFKREHLINYLISYSESHEESHSPNTIETDVKVFLKNYVKPTSSKGNNNIEDQYASLLIDLDLVKEIKPNNSSDGKWYKIESSERDSLPLEIFYYSILQNEDYGNSISFQKLLNGKNSPGNVFALHPDALIDIINRLVDKYDEAVFKEDAGVRELQINKSFDNNQLEGILENYYVKN